MNERLKFVAAAQSGRRTMTELCVEYGISLACLMIGFVLLMWKQLVPGPSRIPWVSVVLVALGCLGIEVAGETWRFGYAGLPQTSLILGLVGLVFLFRASSALEDLLVRLEVLPERIPPKYGILFPVAMVLVSFRFSWEAASLGESGPPSWQVWWGDADYSAYFLFALFVVLKLGRMLRVLSAAKDEVEAEAA